MDNSTYRGHLNGNVKKSNQICTIKILKKKYCKESHLHFFCLLAFEIKYLSTYYGMGARSRRVAPSVLEATHRDLVGKYFLSPTGGTC